MIGTSVERIAEAVERELTRVKVARPALASRISRAEGIIVTHLSYRRQRVIRVRTNADGARFLVSGSGGAVYVVGSASWECSCPDHHRRGAGCKHALACWALWRASARPADRLVGRVRYVLGDRAGARVRLHECRTSAGVRGLRGSLHGP